jgi:hypothetical protein
LNKQKKVEVRSTRFFRYFLSKGFFPFSQPSVIFKRNFYFDVNGFDIEHFKIVGDMDLFYRMSITKNKKFGYKKLTTSEFLKYGNSLGDNNTSLGKNERSTIGRIPKPVLSNRLLLKFLRIMHI